MSSVPALSSRPSRSVRRHLPAGRWRARAAVALAAAVLALPAVAAWPEKPVSMIVPFAPGGSSDNVGRTLAAALGERLGQSVVVENVGGAGGVVGTQRAVRAAPDGYTLLLGSGSEILINKLINPAIAYDGVRDLVPIAFVGTGPMVLVGRPDLPAAGVADVLRLARSKPGGLSYASAGNGTPMHVAGELLKMRAGVFMVHIPYRGAAPALVDLAGGQVDLAVSTLSAAQPAIKAGRIKAFATTGARPSELAPGLPALGGQPGLDGFDLEVWFGLFVPVKTPADVVQKLQATTQQVLADPAIRRRLADQGIAASGASADALRSFMAGQVETYRAVVKAANMKPD